MPGDICWFQTALTPGELASVRYLDWPYWTDFSGGTRLAADAARLLRPWQSLQARTIYRQIAENLRRWAVAPAADPDRPARPGQPGGAQKP